MGSLLGAAGAASNFQAQNPYSQQVLQNALNNQGAVMGTENSLGQALANQMQGIGPNPAQAQFQNNVNQNIAQTQGLIASQRGLNPALAARMGSAAGAAANQQAAGQAAVLQAQQQLAAQQQLQGLTAQEQQGNLAQQQLYNQASLGAQGLSQQTQAQNAGIVGNTIGGVLNAGGGIGAALLRGSNNGMSHGGKVKGAPKVNGDSEKNDTVPAMLSPGEIVVPRSKAHDPEKAKEFIDHLMKSEGKEDGEGYGKILEHKRKVHDLEKRIKVLEGKKRSA